MDKRFCSSYWSRGFFFFFFLNYLFCVCSIINYSIFIDFFFFFFQKVIFGVGLNQLSDAFEERIQGPFSSSPFPPSPKTSLIPPPSPSLFIFSVNRCFPPQESNSCEYVGIPFCWNCCWIFFSCSSQFVYFEVDASSRKLFPIVPEVCA